MFKAEVVLASESPDGVRLYSVLATYPRFIHAEIMTHRDRARNAASSRAIPWKKYVAGAPVAILEAEAAANICDGRAKWMQPNCMFKMVRDNPVIPIVFGAEKKGMQTGDSVDDPELARAIWLDALADAMKHADRLATLGVHKSLVNRLVEPFMWMTVLMTATEWKNFYRLRCHPDAEIHFKKIAGMIHTAIDEAPVQKLRYGEWHLPFICAEEAASLPLDIKKCVSAGRCARLSYLTHDGRRDHAEDVALCDRLINRQDGVLHASPLEHVAQAMEAAHRSGPYRGWKQFRKEFANENVVG